MDWELFRVQIAEISERIDRLRAQMEDSTPLKEEVVEEEKEEAPKLSGAAALKASLLKGRK